MELSLSKLPWYAQIGAFVLVSAGAVYGFWHFYVTELEADIAARESRLVMQRADLEKGLATVRQLPEFEAQVGDLEDRLETLRSIIPEQKDVADILRRIQGLATRSNLALQRFQPGTVVQQKLYAEIPYRLQAEGSYHNLAAFFDQVSRFPRIINVSEISIKAKDDGDPSRSVVAECVATTFVLQEGALGPAKGKAKRAPAKK